jgi:sugar/nucleoside kinase (ribokinase family)
MTCASRRRRLKAQARDTAMKRNGIVLAGTVILDIVHLIDHWPAEEMVAMVARTEYGAGGPPLNAAAGLMKLGAMFPVTCKGVVGDDDLGRILINNAASHGLDTSGIRSMAGQVTSHTQVMTSQSTAKRTFFHQVGVNAMISADMLLPETDEARIFYVGSPGIAQSVDTGDGWRRLLRAARSRGFLTALEMVPTSRESHERLVRPCVPLVDIMVVNDNEAEHVAGMTVTQDGQLDWQAAEICCKKLLDMGVGLVAAIHHPDGAVGAMRDGSVARAGSVKVLSEEIIGTVGAGDAFFAGVLFGLHEGWDLQRCLSLGNAAAATSLQSATTCASIRPWTECLAYAARHGVRQTG